MAMDQYSATRPSASYSASMASEPQVTAEVARIGEASEGLQKLAAALEERLGALLRPEPPTAIGMGQKDEQPRCPMAERLRGYNYALQGVDRHLSSLLQRLEI